MQLLQTCCGGDKSCYHFLLSENFLLCILETNFVVVEERCKVILSFSIISFSALIRNKLEILMMLGAIPPEMERPGDCFGEDLLDAILLESFLVWM